MCCFNSKPITDTSRSITDLQMQYVRKRKKQWVKQKSRLIGTLATGIGQVTVPGNEFATHAAFFACPCITNQKAQHSSASTVLTVQFCPRATPAKTCIAVGSAIFPEKLKEFLLRLHFPRFSEYKQKPYPSPHNSRLCKHRSTEYLCWRQINYR